MKNPCLSVLALVATLLAGCGEDTTTDPSPDDSSAAGVLSVYVVNYPLQYFAERIGGEQVQVRLPVPPDVDPAFWTPDGEAIGLFQTADVILLNGATYAKWVEKASLPRAAVVDTSAAFADRFIRTEDAVTHGHGPDGEHSHAGTAFTTWLDPTQAVLQARSIAGAFARVRPQHEGQFRAALTRLEAELNALDQRLTAVTKSLADVPLVFSHPVYQYLIRRYGLDGVALYWEPDSTPDFAELEELLATRPARYMIWEGQPLRSSMERLGSMGLTSVVFDPCGNVPDEGDFMTVMEANVGALVGLR